MQSLGKLVSLVLIVTVVGSPMLAASISNSSPQEILDPIPLPFLPEASDEELLAAEGEFWWFLVGLVLGGGARAVYENWFDEDYGIDKDDLRDIAGTALVSGVGGSCGGMISAIHAVLQ